MRAWLLAGLIATGPGAADTAAQDRSDARALIIADRPAATGAARQPVYINLPAPLQSALPARPAAAGRLNRGGAEDFRVARAPFAENRMRSEVEAMVGRRPRAFAFRPMMSLTFDTNDLDAPARVGGIAPRLLGASRQR
ncbi:hypothetical protein OK349_02255 [Sphingomonas sp. BT-65]|uniref:hypothetical protein n=1 Tax=Sphingomonas sp. BT-65 TaxID=2989821 RepID=UPI0022355AA8|nr:hypothetical protein [Sphingomonas sp. BT-65]MCW4460512.1 hypothetical protein [Sphingomonas sp. BT-65]